MLKSAKRTPFQLKKRGEILSNCHVTREERGKRHWSSIEEGKAKEGEVLGTGGRGSFFMSQGNE